MTGQSFEEAVNNILNTTPPKGLNGSGGITKAVFKNIVSYFRAMLDSVNAVYENSMEWKGVWVVNGVYSAKDVVTKDGSTYRCKVGNQGQVVTNTMYWELVASKGDAGDSVQNFGGSMVRNSAFELGSMDSWFPGYVNTFNGVFNLGMKVYGFHTLLTNKYRFNRRKLLKMSGYISTSLASVPIYWRYFDDGGYSNNFTAGGVNYEAKQFAYPDLTYFEFFSNNGVLGNNTCKFDILLGGSGANNPLNDVNKISGFIVKEVEYSEYVPSNLAWLPDGQAVYDVANPLKKGVYINAANGIVWHTVNEVTLQPAGSGVAFNIRRPYKFTWSVGYNDGVTVNSQPAALINANTDALLTLSGSAGKTMMINIQQIA